MDYSTLNASPRSCPLHCTRADGRADRGGDGGRNPDHPRRQGAHHQRRRQDAGDIQPHRSPRGTHTHRQQRQADNAEPDARMLHHEG